MEVRLSLGEIVDRMTILDLKRQRLQHAEAISAVEAERIDLESRWRAGGHPPTHTLPGHAALCLVNAELWDIEDALRACEAAGEFGDPFVALARSVYQLNDRRASLKRAIDLDLGSSVREWKSHNTDQ